MALSPQQQIAAIENQLAKLKDQLEEQENPQKTFRIVFEYNTNKKLWDGQEPTQERIHSLLKDRLISIGNAMHLYRGLELVEVIDVEILQ
jgi:hypothetical protein